MHLTGPVIRVIVGAVRTRAAVADTGSHAVDLGACGDGQVGRWRRGTEGESVVVSDRL